MLLGSNVRLFTASPFRVAGLFSLLGADSVTRRNSGSYRNLMDGEGSWDGTNSVAFDNAIPLGYYPPAAWLLPRTAGGLAAGRTRIVGDGTVSAANLAGGVNLASELSGSGTISNAGIEYLMNAAAIILGEAIITANLAGATYGETSITGSGTLTGDLAGASYIEAATSGTSSLLADLVGALSASGSIGGDSTLLADIAGALNAEAALSGSGTLSADIYGKWEMVASLSGTSTVTAAITALAHLVAAINGDSTLSGAVVATGFMTADISQNSGELTVGAIADAVWDEVLASHLTSGTTGAALNGAGSAGDPWGTSIPGAYGAGTAGKLVGDLVESGAIDGLDVVEAIRVLLAVMAGKTTVTDLGGGASTIAFRDVADTKDRVEADMTGNERTDVTVDGS